MYIDVEVRIESLKNPDDPITPRSVARWYLLKRLERHLVRTRSPRLQMLLMILATGSVGLLASTALLRLQVRNMALRYVICVAAAYRAFLMLVWLWVLYQRRRWNRFARADGSPAGDFPLLDHASRTLGPCK